jgi:predicted aspartyl protease
MMRRETRFLDIDGDLIMVRAVVTGPNGPIRGRFALDTGAAVTTMQPQIARLTGYGPRDAFKRTRVRTAIGAESGYVVHVGAFTALGFTQSTVAINVFALGHGNIDGLVGMNFLSDFNFEVRPAEQRILAERIIP